MSRKEVTHLIERMEMIEERLGITISGLYASIDEEPYDGGKYSVNINGEVYSQSGGGLSQNITLQYIGQNEKGQIVGSIDEYLFVGYFTGYHVFSARLYCEAYPTRIKVIPRAG